MGKRSRNKFERLVTDDEESSSSDNDSLLNHSDDEVPQNENNNSSTSKSGKITDLNQTDKYLITRSKRKYTKRQVVIPVKDKFGFGGESTEGKSNQIDNSSNDKRKVRIENYELDTSKSILDDHIVDDRITEANKCLAELQSQIKSREDEIAKLKSMISKDRAIEREPSGNIILKVPECEYTETVVTPRNVDDVNENNTAPINDVVMISDPADEGVRDLDRQKSCQNERMNEGHRSRNAFFQKRKRSRSRSGSAQKQKRGRESDSSDLDCNNPAVQRLVDRMVSEQVAAELEKRSSNAGLKTPPSRPLPKLKSPSNSTIYTPAVERANDKQDYVPVTDAWVKQQTRLNDREAQTIDHVSRFLNDMRFNSDQRRETPHVPQAAVPGTSSDKQRCDQVQQVQQQQRARSAAETAILDAERFKAQIQQPSRGNQIHFNNPIPNVSEHEKEQIRHLRYLDNEDDEFFHTTCHIEQATREKIEMGAFIELSKLLQKGAHIEPRNNRLQLVNKDGMSYFVPSLDRETKIDNIKKWEQAFRVYTTIYCNANPTRSGEILQYVDVIHRAAATFSWENVAKYDYVFRQLMAAKPHRSWAKVYTQMWNITLNEPLKKFPESAQFSGRNGNGKKRESVCWKFNKGNCTYGKGCKFEHKCSYCGGSNHGASTCLKKQNKRSGEKNKSNGNNN